MGLKDKLRVCVILMVVASTTVVVSSQVALANSCHRIPTNYFDGEQHGDFNNPVSTTGARARIGFPGAVLDICNEVVNPPTPPDSGSHSWAGIVQLTGCVTGGWLQTGYVRKNHDLFDPNTNYLFVQRGYCRLDFNLDYRDDKLAYSLGGSNLCYTAGYSGLLSKWVGNVASTCGGTILWEKRYDPTDFNFGPNQNDWFSEVHDYYQVSGASSSANSDNVCGYSTNKCTFSGMQERDLSGVWHNADYSSVPFMGPGASYGYCFTQNSPNNFAVWTHFPAC
jgi:hypothetical protein